MQKEIAGKFCVEVYEIQPRGQLACQRADVSDIQRFLPACADLNGRTRESKNSFVRKRKNPTIIHSFNENLQDPLGHVAF